MSEALPPPQPQQDADIATMAADLAKRRRRLQLLNLAILLLPLAAGAIFLAFGRNDREWVRDEVGVSVTETVSSKVEETVPRTVQRALTESPVTRRIEALEAASSVLPEHLGRSLGPSAS
jgi:hypothetical protein